MTQRAESQSAASSSTKRTSGKRIERFNDSVLTYIDQIDNLFNTIDRELMDINTDLISASETSIVSRGKEPAVIDERPLTRPDDWWQREQEEEARPKAPPDALQPQSQDFPPFLITNPKFWDAYRLKHPFRQGELSPGGTGNFGDPYPTRPKNTRDISGSDQPQQPQQLPQQVPQQPQQPPQQVPQQPQQLPQQVPQQTPQQVPQQPQQFPQQPFQNPLQYLLPSPPIKKNTQNVHRQDYTQYERNYQDTNLNFEKYYHDIKTTLQDMDTCLVDIVSKLS